MPQWPSSVPPLFGPTDTSVKCHCNLPCQRSDGWPVLQIVGGKVEQQMVYVSFRCAELENLMLYYIVTYQATSGKFVCFLSFFCWCSSYFSSS
jgi:hypothetical protein